MNLDRLARFEVNTWVEHQVDGKEGYPKLEKQKDGSSKQSEIPWFSGQRAWDYLDWMMEQMGSKREKL